MRQAALVCMIVQLLVSTGAAQSNPPIVEIRVHGNHATPDADVLRLSGLTVGEPASDASLAAARTRLEASGRFASVAVRKLARSIDDPNDVMVMLLVEEVAGATQDVPHPGWLKQTAAGIMWLPVLRYDEGYGFTYGVQPAIADLFGAQSRVAAPLTWGGERRAGVDVTRMFEGPVVSRVMAGADVRRTEHPAFDVVERRTGVRARVERQIGPILRVGAEAGRDEVRFGGERGTVTRYLGDLVVDTRIDPAFPRNAVWGRAELGRLDVATGLRRQHRADANVAVGLFAGSALTLRAFQTSASGTLPAYERAMIGGGPSLRGHRVGYRVDDNAAGASASWALLFGSPLSVARTGVRLFADWAAAYPAGTSWRDASYDRGLGVGWFGQLAAITTGIDVARGTDRWRVHFRLGTKF